MDTYIESSVISYLTAKENPDLIIAARQKMTKNWWKHTSNSAELFISTYVIDEISQGDHSASEMRLKAIKICNLLPASNEISLLAKEYCPSQPAYHTRTLSIPTSRIAPNTIGN
jgi:hypothetical protein